jgi:ATP-dependent RNA/DNA helicase IGHMBP2
MALALILPMDYFKEQLEMLRMEREEDRKSSIQMLATMSVADRRENGVTWYPVVIKDVEVGTGDYITVEVERPTYQDVIHQFRFGMTAALFSNYSPTQDRVEGTISYISNNRLRISLRTDELPDWAKNGKLGIDAVFDEYSYNEMENALKQADQLSENTRHPLISILTGLSKPDFEKSPYIPSHSPLNEAQQKAVKWMLEANQLAIVHGPPGTGKTTTLVHGIQALYKKDQTPILVVAPSNAAVDLLSERLSDGGMQVVRIGNPARVTERLSSLSLDHQISSRAEMKEIKRLKKQADEYRNLALKYKRSYGKEERDQRKALLNEAKKIAKEISQLEKYIADDILSSAQIITATLVGANHSTIKHLKFNTVVIDEAAQALEPATWIPVLKSHKVIMAGDHCQLPPTIKSQIAANKGLSVTLFEKCAQKHPEAVVTLNRQYRMHEAIMGFSSLKFYKDELLADPTVSERVVFNGDEPFSFIDTAGCGFEEKWEGTRLSNPEEGRFLLRHLTFYLEGIAARSIDVSSLSFGIISPYRHQVEVLKDQLAEMSSLENFYSSIAVNTIDSFQGQERDVIYISLTRSNAEHAIGFLTDIRRMNVAMTRAKKKLVVIGDSSTLAQFPFYEDLIAYAQDRNAYKSAWEFSFL